MEYPSGVPENRPITLYQNLALTSSIKALIHVRLLKWGVVRNEKLEVKQKRRKKGKREKLYLSIPHKKRQEKAQVARARNMSIGIVA